jgi:primosomal protein N' (replication factor Y)
VQPRVARVAVPSPLRRLFDYLLPTTLADGILPGCRVQVPFGARNVTGVVVEVVDSSTIAHIKMKAVLGRLDKEPVLGGDLFRLCQWAATYYQHPLGDVVATALPVLLRQGEPAGRRNLLVWRATPGGLAAPDSAVARAPKQANALSILKAHPQGIPRALAETMGLERPHLVALQKKGLVEEVTIAGVAAGVGHDPGTPLLGEVPLTPSTAQAEALARLRESGAGFRTFLIEGVTGSGKTEVYLQRAADVIAEGRQVLVLVPEIGLTPQTVERFRRRFNRPVAVLHSGLNDRERLDAWLDAAEGRAAIILGTRSAVFTPMARPGLLIVDEEHDTSFKQQEGFRYHARDLAIMRGKFAGIPVILGTATPSLESLHNASQGKYAHLHLRERAAASTPRMDVVDIRKQKLQEGIGESLLAETKATLARGDQALLFINRRGFAPVLVCHDCGWTADCRRCDARYTLHLQPRHLHCHHCGSEAAIPRACPGCGGTDLVAVGLGTERVEQTVASLLPGYPVLRLDSDSTRRRHSMSNALAQVHSGKPLILVGTQMLAKGHHFPHVTLVGILDADSGLLSSDFRATERLAQILVQVAGRAGRAGKPGRVLVQTRQPGHPLLTRLLRDGYDAWATDALAERKLAELPPWSQLALLRAEATRETTAFDWLDNMKMAAASLLSGGNGDVLLMGPAPAPMARRGGRYRAQLLIQSATRGELHQFLTALLPVIEADPESRRVRWSLDVDPVDLY